MNAAATEPWLQIYVSVYVRFKSEASDASVGKVRAAVNMTSQLMFEPK